MISVNGREIDNCEYLVKLLEKGGYRSDRVAVEINGKIIKRSDYESVKINDGDKIEVVNFVGGG